MRTEKLNSLDVLVFCHYADFNPDGSSRLLSSLEDDFQTKQLSHHKYVLPSRTSRSKTLGLSNLTRSTFLFTALWRLSVRALPKFPYLHTLFANQVKNKMVKLIKRERPRLVVVTGEFLPLNLAAAEVGVETVEILHGRNYQQIEWGYDARSTEELPNHLVCFDQQSLTTFTPIRRLGVELHHAKSQLPFKVEDSRVPPKATDKLSATVLVPGQWGKGFIGPINFSNELLRNLITRLRTSSFKIRIIFVPHPVQLITKRYRKDLQVISQLAEEYNHLVLPSNILRISVHKRYLCLGYDSGLMTDLSDINIPSIDIEAFWAKVSAAPYEDLGSIIQSASAFPQLPPREDELPSLSEIIIKQIPK